MFKIRQHIPNCVSGFEPEIKEFSTLDELQQIWFVRIYITEKGFSHLAISTDNIPYDVNFLMAIYDKGKRWRVVGFITGDDISSLKLKEWKK
jgi:hypothetical protein